MGTSESRNIFLISNTQVSSCLYICSLSQSPNSIPKPFVLKSQLSSPYWKGSSGFVSCAHDKQLGSMEKPLTIDWKRIWTWSFTICCWRGYKKCKWKMKLKRLFTAPHLLKKKALQSPIPVKKKKKKKRQWLSWRKY